YHTARIYSGGESISQPAANGQSWVTKAAKPAADWAGDAMYELGKSSLTNNGDPENKAEATQ
ncbi:hypothetical protein Q2378_27535, partial [Escherichia coli]|nr:hypothetical protein [Escherichia coli]